MPQPSLVRLAQHRLKVRDATASPAWLTGERSRAGMRENLLSLAGKGWVAGGRGRRCRLRGIGGARVMRPDASSCSPRNHGEGGNADADRFGQEVRSAVLVSFSHRRRELIAAIGVAARDARRGARPVTQRQRKIWKCPSTYQRITNTKMVVKQPPPSFFAPQPAATPRKSLLICSDVKQSACQHRGTNKAATSGVGPGHWPRAECHAETRRYAPVRKPDRNPMPIG
jgi:hypothetical protein